MSASGLRTCPGCRRPFAMLHICESCGRCDAQELPRDADRAPCCTGDCVARDWRAEIAREASSSKHVTEQQWVPDVREDGVYLVAADDRSTVLKLCRHDHGSDLLIAGYVVGLQARQTRQITGGGQHARDRAGRAGEAPVSPRVDEARSPQAEAGGEVMQAFARGLAFVDRWRRLEADAAAAQMAPSSCDEQSDDFVALAYARGVFDAIDAIGARFALGDSGAFDEVSSFNAEMSAPVPRPEVMPGRRGAPGKAVEERLP